MEQRESYPVDIEQERRTLVDYVTSQGDGLAEHLGKVVDYLHHDLTYLRMLEHAKNLINPTKESSDYDIKSAVSELTEKELGIVKNYLLKVTAYISNDVEFEAVKKAARELSYSKPMPDTIYAPPGEFPLDLARAMEEV